MPSDPEQAALDIGSRRGPECATRIAFGSLDLANGQGLTQQCPRVDHERVDPGRRVLRTMGSLSTPDLMRIFPKTQVREGVDIPAPTGPPPPWMESRPAGIRAFVRAAEEHLIPDESYRRLTVPVHQSHGSLSSQIYGDTRARLEALLPRFTAEVYEGAHHLRTSHQVDPARVAMELRRLWEKSPRN